MNAQVADEAKDRLHAVRGAYDHEHEQRSQGTPARSPATARSSPLSLKSSG